MPRTKRVTSKKSKLSTPEDSSNSAVKREILINRIEDARQMLINKYAEAEAELNSLFKTTLLKIPLKSRKKTIGELGQENVWGNVSKSFNITKNITQSLRRSMSDDGYSTSESRGTSGTALGSARHHKSRRSNSATRSSTSKNKTNKRVSRSCSRLSKPTKVLRELSLNRLKTPQNSKKIESFGMVTPKVKPNTPHVVLRRPIQGEMALSLQGSPLMTTAMVSETTANINIPLGDGRMINVQPIRGLRTSEIPELDPEVRKQLLTLKENLDKVCRF